MDRNVNVKVKTLSNFSGKLPEYKTSGASGLDVCAQLTDAVTVQPGKRFLVPTGLSFEIPPGFEIQVRPRSGLALLNGISVLNTPGTVDADYLGEVKVIIVNLGDLPFTINPLDRIAQLVLSPVYKANLILSNSLTETERGSSGFGSTGV